MCGFIGVFDLSGRHREIDRERFVSGVKRLAHRGPDDESFSFGAGAALGFRRLSIVDLETGRQPMANEDETIRVVENGEIYNHGELRRDLEAAGHRFRSRSDAEVLVHGYESWGMDGLLARLKGMFAFALWDAGRGEFHAARDRMGIKPLYLAESDGRLYVGSEITPILTAAGLDCRMNPEALGHFMRLGFTPGPGTLFAGVSKVPAGCRVAVQGGTCRTREYWALSYAEGPARPNDEVVAEFRERLGVAVRSHLMSDVPVGALLSGGVDSASVVSHMAAACGGRMTTVTVGFDVERFDETARATACAKELGIQNRLIRFDGNFMDDYPRLVAAVEEPVARSTFAALYHLFAACKSVGLKVALTGEGSDELFGGYSWHWRPDRGRWWAKSAALLKAASSGLHPWLERGVEGWRRLEDGMRLDSEGLARRYLRHLQIARAEEGTALLAADVREAVARERGETLIRQWRQWVDQVESPDPFQRILWLQSRTRMPDYINCIVDRMSMHHSVEARPPFLDHTLWEFCAPLPRRLKVRGYAPYQEEKFLLREAGKGLVPEVNRRARKMPLRVPFIEWLRQERLPEWAEEALSERAIRALGVFDPVEVVLLRREFGLAPESKGTLLMAVLTIQVWAGIFGCRR